MTRIPGVNPNATSVLVVRADGPETVERLEMGLNGSTLDWCAPGVDLGDAKFDLILLANADRSPEMVEWVARQVRTAVTDGGRYQWRDKT